MSKTPPGGTAAIPERARNIPVAYDADVVVVGAGPGGFAAASGVLAGGLDDLPQAAQPMTARVAPSHRVVRIIDGSFFVQLPALRAYPNQGPGRDMPAAQW